jgi:CheY-like chemotaxis protein
VSVTRVVYMIKSLGREDTRPRHARSAAGPRAQIADPRPRRFVPRRFGLPRGNRDNPSPPGDIPERSRMQAFAAQPSELPDDPRDRPDIRVTGEAADAAEALRQDATLRPHVVLMDIRMPNLDGLEATRRLVAADAARVLVLTTFDKDEYVYEA